MQIMGGLEPYCFHKLPEHGLDGTHTCMQIMGGLEPEHGLNELSLLHVIQVCSYYTNSSFSIHIPTYTLPTTYLDTVKVEIFA